MTTVLVVDDNRLDRELTALVLRHCGYEVVEAGLAAEALALMETTRPDVVVSDLLMPGMDGYEFAWQLRGDARFRSVPVLFLSATYDEREMMDLSIVYGGCHFLAKPSEPDQIAVAVERALTAPRPAVEPTPDLARVQFERLRLLNAKLLKLTEEAERQKAELLERARQQAAVAVLGQEALGHTDLGRMLAVALQIVQETLGAELVEILELLPGGEELLLRAGSGWRDGAVGEARVPARCGSPGGYALLVGTPVVADDLQQETRFRMRELYGEHGVTSGVSVPIRVGDGPWGALGAYTRTRRSFPQRDVHFLQTVANAIAQAIARIRTEAEAYRLAAIVESASDAIVGLDLDRRVVAWNQAAERLYGYSQEEMLGHPIDVLEPEDRRHEAEEASARIARGEVPEPLDTVRRHKDGTLVPVMLVLSPVRERDGTLVGYSSIARDVSRERAAEEERRSLAAQLQQAQKLEAIGRLAGGVAHDFNNLLTVIAGHCELMLQHTQDQAVRESALEVQRAGQRATSLTKQLLAFGRRQVLEPVVVDANEIVAATAAMLRRVIGADIELDVRPAPSPCPVHVDPGQLELVLMNLAVNARDAMPRGGCLTVEIRQVPTGRLPQVEALGPGPCAAIAVADTGVGMDEQTRARIFEPFFTTKAPGEGTGLGLATALGIVQQSGGLIDVASVPGSGTTFTVYLPLATEPAVRAEPPAPPRPVEGGTETILLVEDDESVRDLVRQMLVRPGYRVLAAENAGEALDMIDRHPEVELVLTDMILPGSTGIELVQEVETRRPAVETLLMTGYSEQVVADRNLGGRTLEMIQKPFTSDVLLHAVRRLLDRRRSNSRRTETT